MKSKKLVDITEMKSATTDLRIHSVEEKIEEVTATFKERWCETNDEDDFEACCEFLSQHDKVMIAYDAQVNEAGLLRAKRNHCLDQYGISGRALITMMQEKRFADAISLYISQAVGCCQEMAKMELHSSTENKLQPQPAPP